MRDVVWILDPATMRFLYVSPSVEALRGYTPTEVMAEPMDAALTAEAAREIRRLATERMKALEDGTAFPDAYYREEVEQPCKDGSSVWTEVITRYVRDLTTGRVEIYGVTRDITERRASSLALAESERHFRLLANNMSDVVTWVGADGTYKWVSPSLTEALGWQPEDWVGRSAFDETHPEDTDRFREQRARMAEGRLPLENGTWVDRFRARDKSEQYHWIETRTRAYVNDKGERDGAVVTFHLIDSVIAAEDELMRRARYDDLTGAFKREAALERLDGISQGHRSPGARSAVLFIDVDGLKAVNDSLGHLAGDALLSTLGTRFIAAVRTADSVARIGGDEFLIILDGLHSVDEAVAIAEKMLARAVSPVPFHRNEISVSVSIGVTMICEGEAVDAVIARADAAMYASKRAGGNTIVAAPAPDVTAD
jgi:diguanylate cyclase (GGDEF)-like protein/PAS domain S-box-containing protein